MSLPEMQAVGAFAAAGVLTLFILIGQRRLGIEHMGSVFVAFMAGRELPFAIYLCSFVFHSPSPQLIHQPQDYEIDISAAGLLRLLTSIIALSSLYYHAFPKAQARRLLQAVSQRISRICRAIFLRRKP